METQLKIIIGSNHLLKIREDWDNQINNYSENPFLFSALLSEFMLVSEQSGWTPVIFSFWIKNKLIGVIPLKLKKAFFSYRATTLNDEVYSDIFLQDESREACLRDMIEVLFEKMNCKSLTITAQKGTPYFQTLKKMQLKEGFNFLKLPYMGRALLPIENDWNKYYSSLKRTKRKKIRKNNDKIMGLKNYSIKYFEVTPEAVTKILSIENMSWKANWRKKKKINQDSELLAIINGLKQNNGLKTHYDSEAWILEGNGKAIAYQLVLIYKGVSYFIKTSYNSNFASFSPGTFVINSTIQGMFERKNVKLIDFITDLPFLTTYNPKVDKREELHICKNCLIVRVKHFIYRYPKFKAVSKYISIRLEKLNLFGI